MFGRLCGVDRSRVFEALKATMFLLPQSEMVVRSKVKGSVASSQESYIYFLLGRPFIRISFAMLSIIFDVIMDWTVCFGKIINVQRKRAVDRTELCIGRYCYMFTEGE